MYQKNTRELEDILQNTRPDEIADFLKEHNKDLLGGERDFMKYMNEKFKEKKISKQEVCLRADISQGYGYKLLSEEKVTRQRDILLRICFASNFTLSETQQALQIYHMDTLYARDPRDALLMTFFNEGENDIIKINQSLVKNKMEPLRSCGIQE